uniref:Uncharacterized protein n=1 Tax=Molossus molossus TaxID=27622 RepID=A0A7J8CYY6_MOLMO|nr:hypothetical protein HJG59_009425 [Molossus molossus]
MDQALLPAGWPDQQCHTHTHTHAVLPSLSSPRSFSPASRGHSHPSHLCPDPVPGWEQGSELTWWQTAGPGSGEGRGPGPWGAMRGDAGGARPWDGCGAHRPGPPGLPAAHGARRGRAWTTLRTQGGQPHPHVLLLLASGGVSPRRPSRPVWSGVLCSAPDTQTAPGGIPQLRAGLSERGVHPLGSERQRCWGGAHSLWTRCRPLPSFLREGGRQAAHRSDLLPGRGSWCGHGGGPRTVPPGLPSGSLRARWRDGAPSRGAASGGKEQEKGPRGAWRTGRLRSEVRERCRGHGRQLCGPSCLETPPPPSRPSSSVPFLGDQPCLPAPRAPSPLLPGSPASQRDLPWGPVVPCPSSYPGSFHSPASQGVVPMPPASKHSVS